ncbi:MAG: hypothetical protein ACOCP4_03055 [Candidatus Woesearchaeota archaeon]
MDDAESIRLKFKNDPWLDNGLEYLYKILDDNFDQLDIDIKVNDQGLEILPSNRKTFPHQLGNVIINTRQNLVVWGEDKNGQKKEIKKDYVLVQERKKEDGKVQFKEDIFTNKSPNVINKIIELIYSDGNNKCILCGDNYSKAYKKLQQASYPFVTKIKSMGGVRSYKDGEHYSFKEYFTDFCPKCYLLGILVWADSGLIYRTFPGDKSYLFLPAMDTLKELSEFKESYRYILNPYRYSNVTTKSNNSAENTPGEYSTILCFYERFFSEIQESSAYASRWNVLHIPFGPVKNIKFDSINLKQNISEVMKELDDEDISVYGDILKSLYFFNDKPGASPVDWNITWNIQEMMSEYFIKDNFRHFTRQLLPRKGGHVGFSKEGREDLENLIYIWRWKQMGIPKEQLQTIKSVGNIIAIASNKNLRLFYKLDKTKNIKEFWDVLREISRKTVSFEEKDQGKIKPTSLDQIVELTKTYENDWKEIRDLLIVYSSMYYSINSISTQKGGNTNE